MSPYFCSRSTDINWPQSITPESLGPTTHPPQHAFLLSPRSKPPASSPVGALPCKSPRYTSRPALQTPLFLLEAVPCSVSSLHRPPSSRAPWGPPRCRWARPSPAGEAPQVAPSALCIALAERAALRRSPPRAVPGAPTPGCPDPSAAPRPRTPRRPHRQSRLPWRARRRRRRELRRRLAAEVKLPQCSRVNSHGGGGGGARGRPLRLLSRATPRRRRRRGPALAALRGRGAAGG